MVFFMVFWRKHTLLVAKGAVVVVVVVALGFVQILMYMLASVRFELTHNP